MKVLVSNVVFRVGSELFWKRFWGKRGFKRIQLKFVEPNLEQGRRQNGPCRSRFQESKIFVNQEASQDRIWGEGDASLDRVERAAMDIRTGWIATSVNVDKNSKFRMEKPASVGGFLLTGSDRRAQTEHSDMQYMSGKSPPYFAMTIGPGNGKVDMCSDPHYYFQPEEQEKNFFVRTLQMRRLVLHFSLCLLEMHKCNLRVLSTLAIKT